MPQLGSAESIQGKKGFDAMYFDEVGSTLTLICRFLEDIPATLECMLNPAVIKLPASTQAVFVQNIIKIYSYWIQSLAEEWNFEVQTEFVKVTEIIQEKILMFCRSADLEVQERVSLFFSSSTNAMYQSLTLRHNRQ